MDFNIIVVGFLSFYCKIVKVKSHINYVDGGYEYNVDEEKSIARLYVHTWR